MMQNYYLALDSAERRLIIESLNNLRSRLIAAGRYTDVVDDLLIKFVSAKVRKYKIAYTKKEVTAMTEYEKMGGTYRQEGDHFLPNLEIREQNEVLIGVWGQRHRRYLKKHHRVRYYNLLTDGTLNSYLTEIELQAQALFNDIVIRLSEEENVTENLKVTAPMEWVGRSNNIRNRAAEIVNAEVIFV